MIKWYTLRVRGGREEEVKEAIEAFILKEKLESSFGGIIVPYETSYVEKKAKKKEENPNKIDHKPKIIKKKKGVAYIFIALDLQLHSELKGLVSSIGGVYGFLGIHGWGGRQEPVPVSSREIDVMLGKVKEVNTKEQLLEKKFVEGEKVKIVREPFEGRLGIVKKVLSGKKKLIVGIKLFRQDITSLELDYVEVNKIKNG